MDDVLLHKAFLAVLPTCLELSGWQNRGERVYTTEQRARLAWDVALTACELHPRAQASVPEALLIEAADRLKLWFNEAPDRAGQITLDLAERLMAHAKR